MSAKFSGPTRNWNCLMASINGADSMSPTVPPSFNTRLTMRRGRDPGGGYLDDADVGLLVCLVRRNLRNTLDPILDRTRNMRHNLVAFLARTIPSHANPKSHLHCLTEVIPTALAGCQAPTNISFAGGMTRTSFSMTSL